MEQTTTISVSVLKDAYNNSESAVQNALKDLFPDIKFGSITNRIKTWEDVSAMVTFSNNTNDAALGLIDKSIKAYLQLCFLAYVLNEGWQPTPKDGGYCVYWVSDSFMNGADPQFDNSGSPGFVIAHNGFGYAYWVAVPRLFFKTYELLKYAVTQFPDLWRDYYCYKTDDK